MSITEITYDGTNFAMVQKILGPYVDGLREESWNRPGAVPDWMKGPTSGIHLVFSPKDHAGVLLRYLASDGFPVELKFIVCRECGGADALEWNEETKAQLISEQLCFYCNLWTKRAPRTPDDNVAIIHGNYFTIGDEKGPASMRGYGGRRFTIRYHDGRQVETTDLWDGGRVPEHFRDRLPDDAEFMKDHK